MQGKLKVEKLWLRLSMSKSTIVKSIWGLDYSPPTPSHFGDSGDEANLWRTQFDFVAQLAESLYKVAHHSSNLGIAVVATE